MNRKIPEDRLREMLSELLEESVFSRLPAEDQGRVESIADALDTEGRISPARVSEVLRIRSGRSYRRGTKNSPPFIAPKPETLARLEEKFARIAQERGRLPKVTYRLRRREHPPRPGIGGGRKGDPGMEALPEELKRRIRARAERYMAEARRRGKDLSRHYDRQPYLMIAMRWELCGDRRAHYEKGKRTRNQKSYYYRIKVYEMKARMKGVPDGRSGD